MLNNNISSLIEILCFILLYNIKFFLNNIKITKTLNFNSEIITCKYKLSNVI